MIAEVLDYFGFLLPRLWRITGDERGITCVYMENVPADEFILPLFAQKVPVFLNDICDV